MRLSDGVLETKVELDASAVSRLNLMDLRDPA
jgi:hypothetical protein